MLETDVEVHADRDPDLSECLRAVTEGTVGLPDVAAGFGKLKN